MKNIKKISESENEVMEVIWEKGDSTIPAVHKRLSENKEWAYNTVGTFMQRLCEKGFLASKKSGKSNIYKAVISKEDYKKSLTMDFLNSIHKGSKRSLIASLFDDKVSNKTIDEMMKLIDRG